MLQNRREYERWLQQAERTLQSAERDKQSGDYNWSCFKAQQAAEFAVKGLLYGIGVSAVGHSLLKFMGDLKERGTKVDEVEGPARTLDRHYIPTRYANAHVEGAPFEFYDLSTAEEALRCANEIIEFVKGVAGHG
jgi:HEPN domain-containing protein